VQKIIGGGIERFLGNDCLPGLHPRQDGSGDGCHAGGKQVGIHHILHRAVGLAAQQVQSLQHGVLGGKLRLVGVRQPGVHVAFLLPLKDGCAGGNIREAERGRLVDGGDMGVMGVVPLRHMVDERAETLFGLDGSHNPLLGSLWMGLYRMPGFPAMDTPRPCG